MTDADKIAEQAAQQARAKALIDARIVMLRKQLKRRFGELPASAEDHLRDASAEQLDDWALQLLDAHSLADVFG